MSSSSSEVEKAQPVDSPGDARARRIAAAVERSKKEYKPEHAVTEREVSDAPRVMPHLAATRDGARA